MSLRERAKAAYDEQEARAEKERLRYCSASRTAQALLLTQLVRRILGTEPDGLTEIEDWLGNPVVMWVTEDLVFSTRGETLIINEKIDDDAVYRALTTWTAVNSIVDVHHFVRRRSADA